jgi:molybdopterin converting factor small subunit
VAVSFLFFAQCADWVGAREAEVDVPEPVRLHTLVKRAPVLAPILKHSRFLRVAINREISVMGAVVMDGDEVAFMPPFSGG